MGELEELHLFVLVRLLVISRGLLGGSFPALLFLFCRSSRNLVFSLSSDLFPLFDYLWS